MEEVIRAVRRDVDLVAPGLVRGVGDLIWIYWSQKDTDNPGFYQAKKRDADGEYIFTKKWIPAGKYDAQNNSPDEGWEHDQDTHPLRPSKGNLITGEYLEGDLEGAARVAARLAARAAQAAEIHRKRKEPCSQYESRKTCGAHEAEPENCRWTVKKPVEYRVGRGARPRVKVYECKQIKPRAPRKRRAVGDKPKPEKPAKIAKLLPKDEAAEIVAEMKRVNANPPPGWDALRADRRDDSLEGIDMTPIRVVPESNEQEVNVDVYNRMMELAKRHNENRELNKFIRLLSKLKKIIENQERYKKMFRVGWRKGGENFAIEWLKNILLNTGFACHPYQQEFQAKDYVDATFNSIYPVFIQLKDVLDERGDAIITPLGKKIVVSNTGICLENAVRAFEEGAETYKIIVTIFQPQTSKQGNMGNYSTDKRSNICLECMALHDDNRRRSECLRENFTNAGLTNFLTEKLVGKQASDGPISRADVEAFVNEMIEYLYDCEQFDYQEEE